MDTFFFSFDGERNRYGNIAIKNECEASRRMHTLNSVIRTIVRVYVLLAL